MVAIFAIDPGGSTGVAMGYFDTSPGSIYQVLKNPNPKDSFTQVGTPLVQARQLFRHWRNFYASALIHEIPVGNCWMVIEDFALSPNAAPGKDILLATQVAHMLLGYRYGAADEFERSHANPIHPMQVAWQTPAEAKSFVSDVRLKRWGLWVKGKQHERDAYRHLALFLNGMIK